MCTRISAIRRLVALYVGQLTANPNYHLQVSIADVDVLTEENIGVVRDLNLYPDMDRQPLIDALHDADRDLRLLCAWLSSPSGSVQ